MCTSRGCLLFGTFFFFFFLDMRSLSPPASVMTTPTYVRETLGLHKHLYSAAAGVSLVFLVGSELCASCSPLIRVCVCGYLRSIEL